MTLIAVHLILAALTPEMFTDPNNRHYLASGTFLGDGNDYALSLNLAVPMCLFLLLESEKALHKVLYGMVLLMLAACIILTQSRGGTLALGFVGFYYWMRSDKKAVTGALAAVVVVGVLAMAPPSYFQRMNSISQDGIDGSAQGRITAWTAGTRMAMSYPLLGVGAGQFPANFVRFAPPNDDPLRWKTAHSIYFLVLGELGLLGLGALLAFIIGNLVMNRRLTKATFTQRSAEEAQTHSRLLACLSASLMGYAIGGAFLSAAYYPHMFVLAGLLTSSRRLILEAAATAPATTEAAGERSPGAGQPCAGPEAARAQDPSTHHSRRHPGAGQPTWPILLNPTARPTSCSSPRRSGLAEPRP